MMHTYWNEKLSYSSGSNDELRGLENEIAQMRFTWKFNGWLKMYGNDIRP